MDQRVQKSIGILIEIATSKLVLKCLDPKKPFELEVDASAFAVRAVLIQWDKQGRWRHARYFSKTLNKTKEKLRHLGPQVHGSDPCAEVLEAPLAGEPPQGGHLDGPHKPTILLPPSED